MLLVFWLVFLLAIRPPLSHVHVPLIPSVGVRPVHPHKTQECLSRMQIIILARCAIVPHQLWPSSGLIAQCYCVCSLEAVSGRLSEARFAWSSGVAKA